MKSKMLGWVLGLFFGIVFIARCHAILDIRIEPVLPLIESSCPLFVPFTTIYFSVSTLHVSFYISF